MIVLAGLGNPGPRYAKTRHNLGYLVAQRIVQRAGGAIWRQKFGGDLCSIELDGHRIVVLKPLTYMNESGLSIQAALTFYKLATQVLLVAHDELDLPFGELRLKQGGGEAGHRGLCSVSRELGSREYARLRLGIGRPPADFPGNTIDYVLQGFALAELAVLDDVVDRAVDAVELVVRRGIAAAMNHVNVRASS